MLTYIPWSDTGSGKDPTKPFYHFILHRCSVDCSGRIYRYLFGTKPTKMPELPEVENFRSLLLPLVSSQFPLCFERCSLDKQPPRKFIDDKDIEMLNDAKYFLNQVLRKGKLIAMVLQKDAVTKYLLIHMGMTGRISTPDYVPQLESLAVNDYPPPHTYIKFTSGTYEASFSDPRKFGSILLCESLQDFDALAPDAWLEVNDETIPQHVEKLSYQSMGIKALLLDQKRVLCGVGNWVADEVLYQTRLHPDQNYLTQEQAQLLLQTLLAILSTAITCLVEKRTAFPDQWLFHYRWNGKKTTKDAQGRIVSFVTSGGRTSAIVPSLQQKKNQLVPSKKSSVSTPRQTGKRQRQSSKVETINAKENSNGNPIDHKIDVEPEKAKQDSKRVNKLPTEPTRKSTRRRKVIE